MTHLPENTCWLNRPQTREIMACLNVGDDSVRAVGGCVRDSLLGYPVTDVDMATTFAPEIAKEMLEKAGFKVIPTGIKHGTITVVADAYRYEITTLREDIKTDGRHAVVKFGTDWGRDAARRDFTINALYADVDGKVYDPLGFGLSDLDARRIRFIGDASKRIAEDYLRVIRFFRFHFHYSSDTPDTDALRACSQATVQKQGLEALSVERLHVELFKILMCNSAVEALKSMHETAVLPFLVQKTEGFESLQKLIELNGNDADALLRLASILPFSAQEVESCVQHLRLSKKQNTRLIKLFDARLYKKLPEDWQAAIYWHGVQSVKDAVRLSQAQGRDGDWDMVLKNMTTFDCPSFPLTSGMMSAAGLAPGPDMGTISKKIEAWWVEQGFPSDINQLKNRLKVEMDNLG